MADTAMRPNIRIEIHNNLVESMEVDEPDKINDEEEGEITDAIEIDEAQAAVQNQQIIRPVPTQRIWPNVNGAFTTGINIFDKEEQSKLVERAKRFALNPDDLHNFTDEQLQELHDSLGISTEEEKDIRFEAIHMRGTDEMSTEDVFEYFGKYGPAGIEWINDESCNVIWNDKISAARALFFLSKSVRGMPVEGPCDPFIKELETVQAEDKENECRSILLKNKDREVELQVDKEVSADGSVHISEITVPVPPGYWRLGHEHSNSKFILMRFAFKSDKKPMRAEKFSEYYKKYGNPNFGGMKGLITETRKQQFKGIFDRNRDIKKDELPEDPKNPWGLLAMNWNEDAQYCEKDIAVVAKPKGTAKVDTGKSNIMSRLGFKRAFETESETKVEEVKKKSKVPRMRMYADEEEEKIKRKRQLQLLKNSRNEDNNSRVNDLRNILREPARKPLIKIEVSEDSEEEKELQEDLGARLKNRNRRLESDRTDILKTSSRDFREYPAKELDARHHRKERDVYSRKEERDSRSGERDRKRERYRRNSPHRYERRMHSDRYEHRRRDPYYEDSISNHKPKSKIAVVIKTQKKPAVASTVWSRINAQRERLKAVSEGKLRVRRDSTSTDSDSGTSSSSSSSSDSSDTGGESDESLDPSLPVKEEKSDRPGFKAGLRSKYNFNPIDHRSPLRIEISNDHFKKE